MLVTACDCSSVNVYNITIWSSDYDVIRCVFGDYGRKVHRRSFPKMLFERQSFVDYDKLLFKIHNLLYDAIIA